MKKSLLLLPGPVMVAQPVLEAAARPMINHRGTAFAKLLARVCGALAPVFGTEGDVVVLGSSGSGGMEAALVNCFSPGDVLLSCAMGVFGLRFAAIARAYGCIVEEFETPLGSAVDARALERRLEADSQRRIGGILLTHNETSTGVQNDMAALAPVVRRHGALSLIDSVSGLGASEFRMDEWGYDVVVTASQKALAAPPGVAMVAASERAWARMGDARIPRFYFDLRRARESAHDGQTPWTPPISILFALDAALERYRDEGMGVGVRASRALCAGRARRFGGVGVLDLLAAGRALGDGRCGRAAGRRFRRRAATSGCEIVIRSCFPAVSASWPGRSCASGRWAT